MIILSFIFTICLSFGFRTGAVMDVYQERRALPQSDELPFLADISDDNFIDELKRYLEERDAEWPKQKKPRLREPLPVNNNDFVSNQEQQETPLSDMSRFDSISHETYSDKEDTENVEKIAPTTTTTKVPTAKSSHQFISTSSAGSDVSQVRVENAEGLEDIYFIAIVAGCSAAGLVAIIVMAILWHKWHKNYKAAADVEYPAYGVTGPNKEISPTGDRRLAQSAQMYHYQHQKQQILAMENSTHPLDQNGSLSEPDSEDDNEEGDYTVYECPGPAPIGEMEVRNPLFLDDPTPATPANAVNKK